MSIYLFNLEKKFIFINDFVNECLKGNGEEALNVYTLSEIINF